MLRLTTILATWPIWEKKKILPRLPDLTDNRTQALYLFSGAPDYIDRMMALSNKMKLSVVLLVLCRICGLHLGKQFGGGNRSGLKVPYRVAAIYRGYIDFYGRLTANRP